jgi:glycosyltransferase involved in cell wall biosynthesis
MEPIRILHVVAAMNRGGLETLIMNIYRNIDRTKVQFDFLTQAEGHAAYDEEIICLGGIIHRLPPRRKGLFRYNKAVTDFFREHRDYGAVHFHISNLSTIAAPVAALNNRVPIRILHSHSSQCPQGLHHRILHHWHQRVVGSLGTHYFACSDLAAAHLFGDKLKHKPVSIINNAINIKKFIFSTFRRRAVREKLALRPDQLVIGHVGSFSYAKNHEFILEIFSEVLKRNASSILMLVGGGTLRPKIEQKAKELAIYNSVQFLGVRSDVEDLMQAMDIFLFPSHHEGLPVTGVEAQAAGLKCFFSDAITRQVDIAGLIEYLPLSRPASAWAEKITSSAGYDRENTSDAIKLAGFDITQLASQLEQVYLGDSLHG